MKRWIALLDPLKYGKFFYCSNSGHFIMKDDPEIKDIPVIKCDGQRNLPDGEVYTAPVKDSVNGYITYNTPSFFT